MLRLVSLTTVLAFAACANQGDEGFIVLNNTAATDTCALTGDPGQPFIAHGEIFTGSSRGYVLTPLLQSRISGTGPGSGAMLDPTTRTVYVKGANVSLEVKSVQIEHADGSFSAGSVTLSDDLTKFSSLVSASLPPNTTINVAFEAIPVPTLRAIANGAGIGPTDALRAEVLATVTMFGEINGDDTQAQPFTFPISVCNDCVVNVTGACPATGAPRAGNPCNAFQDGVVDCCTDATNHLVCPATTAAVN